MTSVVDFKLVKESLKDLTKIYKPKSTQARSFVEWFVKKYKVQRGFENELTRFVISEIERLEKL